MKTFSNFFSSAFQLRVSTFDSHSLRTFNNYSPKARCFSGNIFTETIVNRVDGLETHWNNNITHYICWSTFIQKYGSSSSRVYCVLFKSRMAKFPKTLLLVS